MRRKRKLSRRQRREEEVDDDNGDDDTKNDDLETIEVSDEVFTKRPAGLQRAAARVRREAIESEGIRNEQKERNGDNYVLGFCCVRCTCDSNVVEKLMPEGKDENVHAFITGGRGSCWHRRCCHGFYDLDTSVFRTDYELKRDILGDIWAGEVEDIECEGITSPMQWVTKAEIQKTLKTAEAQESQRCNAEGEVDPLFMLQTNIDYMNSQWGIVASFNRQKNKIEKKEVKKRRAVVADLFANVGTAIVALKQNCIDIKTIIHVEHDKVATHVYRENHDEQYKRDNDVMVNNKGNTENADKAKNENDNNNEKNDDNANNNYDDDNNNNKDAIQHVYDYDRYEDFKKNLKEIIQKFGPIDILVAGPPCVDYSRVNARRQGTAGVQGQYIVDLAETIQEIRRLQGTHPVHFVVENVPLGVSSEEIMRAYGFTWDPIHLNASVFSPQNRDRDFITNIPLEPVDFNKDIEEPESCLEEGFVMPAHIIDPEIPTKAQCSMASSARLDEHQSLRMFVFQDKPKKRIHEQESKKRKKKKKKEEICYLGRPLNVEERTKFMGYPDGYIESPVRNLFDTLTKLGLANTIVQKIKIKNTEDENDKTKEEDDKTKRKYHKTNDEDDSDSDEDDENTYKMTWEHELPLKLHHFAGNYHKLPLHKLPSINAYRCYLAALDPLATLDPDNCSIGLKMAPPVKHQEEVPSFFNADEYGKHLIGLAFSVPVMEHLLRPLKSIFLRREYAGYPYRYAWETTTAAAVTVAAPPPAAAAAAAVAVNDDDEKVPMPLSTFEDDRKPAACSRKAAQQQPPLVSASSEENNDGKPAAQPTARTGVAEGGSSIPAGTEQVTEHLRWLQSRAEAVEEI